jgi:hypothetical protein
MIKHRYIFLCALAIVGTPFSSRAEASADLSAIKTYLVQKAQVMDRAAHDFDQQAAEYAAIIQKNGGNYDQAATHHCAVLFALLVEMQNDYGVHHNNGYETIEGVTAGVRKFVDFDTDGDELGFSQVLLDGLERETALAREIREALG